MLKSYEEMRKVDVRKHCKKRDGIDYLNWAKCIDLLRENGAETVYFEPCTGANGSSLIASEHTFTDKNGAINRCYETKIKVVVDNNTYYMQTPVMNGSNPVKDNLMAINTYHMTLNTSNVKTPDSWIECNRIGNLVMINGCAKITKAVNTYSVLNIASGAPVPCCNEQLYTVAIAQDNTYSNCFLEVSKSGAVNLLVRWQKASSGDIFYYEFCYICK